ncbi:T9SS type A sorting domain-containing protein [Dysgonomonas sp. GY617]|uniref:T9SS type A sorting domain-containing protein n=1 Tax=Dysgonomonas sp. GY617 TaxID=2780420 RepID=UPI0018839904|nr:T9SS type A sorting domain-containing protein [Dysgonomonas sp. GY617]MBF0575587.1 T9SS type A sorting domain-containing protein [Dysgonomonas sp. GY617]
MKKTLFLLLLMCLSSFGYSQTTKELLITFIDKGGEKQWTDGAVIKVSKVNNPNEEILMRGESSNFMTIDLEPVEYLFQILETPQGWILDEQGQIHGAHQQLNPREFIVNGANIESYVYIPIIANKKELLITFIDKEWVKQQTDGAIIRVSKVNNPNEETFIYGSGSAAMTIDLEPTDYLFQILETPQGWILDEQGQIQGAHQQLNPREFIINGANIESYVYIPVIGNKKELLITFTNKEGDKQWTAGAVIRVSKVSNPNEEILMHGGEANSMTIDLEPVEYLFQILEVPQGWILDEQSQIHGAHQQLNPREFIVNGANIESYIYIPVIANKKELLITFIDKDWVKQQTGGAIIRVSKVSNPNEEILMHGGGSPAMTIDLEPTDYLFHILETPQGWILDEQSQIQGAQQQLNPREFIVNGANIESYIYIPVIEMNSTRSLKIIDEVKRIDYIKIFDTRGVLIKETKDINYSTNDLPSGYYIIVTKTDKGISSQKIIK